MSYLERNHVTIEFFVSRAQSAIKVGVAKLPLSKLHDKADNMASPEVQEILHEGGELGASYPIGKVFYKIRMRKPLDEALKWFNQEKSLRA